MIKGAGNTCVLQHIREREREAADDDQEGVLKGGGHRRFSSAASKLRCRLITSVLEIPCGL